MKQGTSQLALLTNSPVGAPRDLILARTSRTRELAGEFATRYFASGGRGPILIHKD